MADFQDELNRRRLERQERRKKQQKKIFLMRVITAVMVLVVLVVGAAILKQNAGSDHADADTALSATQETSNVTAEPTQKPTETPTEAPTKASSKNSDEPTTVIHLAAAGDLVINDSTVSAGLTDGGYDYSQTFLDVASVFAGADLALLNFEGSMVGAPYGTDTGSAPAELTQALKNIGVDLVQVANSCSVTHGVSGLATTLSNIREAGLEPLGAFATAEEYQKYKGYTMVEVQGIRVAFVAFTKGVGGLSLPAGSEDCVNLLYTDYATTYRNIDKEGITQILSNVALEKPDLTIALVHWGSEYKDLVTESQTDIAALMQKNGVDVILGTHSHMLHQIEYDPITGQLVAYSLGDFFGDAQRAGTDYSIILDLEITRDNVSGETKVTDYSYTPIYTLTEDTSYDGQRRVVRLKQTLDAYEANFVDKVSTSVYEDMTYALTRIVDRITPEETEE